MRPTLPILLSSAIALSGIAHAADNPLDYPSIWNCRAGDVSPYAPRTNWYCDDVEQAPPTAAAPPAAPAPNVEPQRIEIPDIRTAEQMRKELARRLDLATMEPTDDHIRDYLQLWQVTQQKGSTFADTWRRVVWQNPALDYTLTRPANNSAIKVFDAQRDQDQETQLRALAKDHGLIFFFRSDCPYCHAMAPAVKMLADKYGIDVLGVSVDGRGIDEFPHPADGRAQAVAWGVERVPALFIGSKQTGDHAAIGFGAMSVSEIVNRLFVLTGTQPGQTF
ncbi:putative TraF conjugative transfer protein [Burkholderia contaminans]|uniref:conjugal transfer protein TraF n=1 Tax=Burkholderia contaminans TaxID=488447 RepID=UPI001453D978|nr:conjugal transfer protein TraF [Burkholderia contaminans]VWD45449.1 putative TraF conjugative transfer protein [Burkholderia contaminans]